MLSNLVDTKDRIARSNIYSIFGKLMKRQIDNNDDGEILLMKAGLSSFWKSMVINFAHIGITGAIEMIMITIIQNMLAWLFVKE